MFKFKKYDKDNRKIEEGNNSKNGKEMDAKIWKASSIYLKKNF